jgi:hypothetical protein
MWDLPGPLELICCSLFCLMVDHLVHLATKWYRKRKGK